MRKTLLMEVIETEMGLPIEVYLHRMMKRGWFLWQIADDIYNRTGFTVSVPTLSTWTRGMGYSLRQAAENAWNHNVVNQATVQQRKRGDIRNVRAIN